MDQRLYNLRFQFDVSTFKLLGRELITDKITALFELVKNCYDANSNDVTVEFHNVSNLSDDSFIRIQDDGLGMSLYDIRYKWMVIGTNSKRKNSVSPSPYFRKVVGEKGVGRFSVEKLGSKILISTTQVGTTRKIFLELDWSNYEELTSKLEKSETRKNTLFFTDIDNKCWVERCPVGEQGTSIIIGLDRLEQLWTKDDIARADAELAKLISPIRKIVYPFRINIKSNEYEGFNKEVVSRVINYSTQKFVLKSYPCDGCIFPLKGVQEYLKFENGELLIKERELENFGPVDFEFHYFSREDIALFKKNYKGASIDGIKIYRDGLITTPFAESESEDTKKRDILGVDKRRYSGFFDKISSNNLIGILDISKENNPSIKDATNRQDFIDCPEYRRLKEYIIEQIEELEKYLSFQKKRDDKETISRLKVAQDDLAKITQIVGRISRTASPELKKELSEISKHTKVVKTNVLKGVRQYQNLEKEILRKENVFLSLLSLQDYAAELSHMVRTTLANIKHMAEFFMTDFPNQKYDKVFSLYAKSIYQEMNKLGSAIDFMLSYARSESDFETFDIYDILVDLFTNIYKARFEELEITSVIDFNVHIQITHNRKFFEDIFENLISNSIKAFKLSENKMIKCTGVAENDKIIITFSDNGCGIPKEDREKVFEIFKTTTQNEGGAGIGLFTVQKRIEALNGKVHITEPEFDHGTTFRIELPFKK